MTRLPIASLTSRVVLLCGSRAYRQSSCAQRSNANCFSERDRQAEPPHLCGMMASPSACTVGPYCRKRHLRPGVGGGPDLGRQARADYTALSLARYCEQLPEVVLIDVTVRVRFALPVLIPEAPAVELGTPAPAAPAPPPAAPAAPPAPAPTVPVGAPAAPAPVVDDAPVLLSGDRVPTISTRLPTIPVRHGHPHKACVMIFGHNERPRVSCERTAALQCGGRRPDC